MCSYISFPLQGIGTKCLNDPDVVPRFGHRLTPGDSKIDVLVWLMTSRPVWKHNCDCNFILWKGVCFFFRKLACFFFCFSSTCCTLNTGWSLLVGGPNVSEQKLDVLFLKKNFNVSIVGTKDFMQENLCCQNLSKLLLLPVFSWLWLFHTGHTPVIFGSWVFKLPLITIGWLLTKFWIRYIWCWDNQFQVDTSISPRDVHCWLYRVMGSSPRATHLLSTPAFHEMTQLICR